MNNAARTAPRKKSAVASVPVARARAAAVLAVRARPVRDPIYYALLVDGALIAIPLCGWADTLW